MATTTPRGCNMTEVTLNDLAKKFNISLNLNKDLLNKPIIIFKTKTNFSRRKPRSNDNFIVMKVDLLRRIGDFDQLIKEYENLTLDEELLDKIIRFQVKNVHEKDDKCYTLEEVL